MTKSKENKRINKLPKSKSSIDWFQFGALGLLVLIWLIMYFSSPHFGKKFNQINLMRQASVLMVAAAAQTFAVIVGGLNIAIGSTVALSAVVSAAVALKYGTIIGYMAGILSGAVTGLILGVAFGIFRVDATIGSVGLMAVAQGLAFQVTKGRPVTGLPQTYRVVGMGMWGNVPILVVVALSTIVLVHFFLSYTVWGRNIYAVGVDEEAARLAGIKVRWYKILSQVISVSLAAWAGVLLSSRINTGIATIGAGMHLEAIAAVILGGTALFSGEGNVLRALIGVMIITILNNGMDLLHVSHYLRDILLGLIVIGVVFINTTLKNR